MLARLIVLFSFLSFGNSKGFSQDNTCIHSLREFCLFLKKDTFSKGPLHPADSMYLKKALSRHFNTTLLIRYYSQDTTLYNLEAKMMILERSILFLDLMIDKVRWKSIQMIPTFSQTQFDAMDLVDKNAYRHALDICFTIKGRRIKIGMALFDEQCKLTEYIPYGHSGKDGEIIKRLFN